MFSKNSDLKDFFSIVDFFGENLDKSKCNQFIIAIIFSLYKNLKNDNNNKIILESLFRTPQREEKESKKDFELRKTKSSKIKQELLECNDEGIDCDFLLKEFKLYLKKQSISYNNVKIDDVVFFYSSTIQKIETFRKNIIKKTNSIKKLGFFVMCFSIPIIFCAYWSDHISLSTSIITFSGNLFSLVLLPLMNIFFKRNPLFYIHYSFQNYKIKKVNFEESFLYDYYKNHDDVKFNRLLNINKTEEVKKISTEVEQKKQNILNINKSNILNIHHLSSETDDNVILLNKYGCFVYFDFKKPILNEDEKKLFEHLLDRCLNNNNFTNLICVNLWNLMSITNGYHVIYNWLSKNIGSLNNIISLTKNKKNMIILISKLSEFYYKNKNSTEKMIMSKNKSINNTIDLILNNLSFENYFEISKELNSQYNNNNNYIII